MRSGKAPSPRRSDLAPLVRREDRIGSAVLVLDSPANRNALSRGLVSELYEHLASARADGTVRAVAITATGGTFCAGADLADPPVEDGPGSFADLLKDLWSYPKPVVAAVNGHVRAGGFGLVAAADAVVCARSASFAFTEVRIGVSPAIISVLCLRRMAPIAASRYMLTGERFGPEEALAAGLVSTVVEDGALASTTDRLLDEFRQCEPNALRTTRSLLRTIPAMDAESGFAHARRVSAEMFSTPEAAEGIAAFREKRPPRWVT